MVKVWRALLASGLLVSVVHATEAPYPAIATGQWRLPQRTVWAGEVFDLSIAWRVQWNSFQNLDGEMEWVPAPLVAGPFSPPVLEAADETGIATIIRSSQAMAVAPGRFAIVPPRQAMALQTGSVVAGGVNVAVTKIFDISGTTASLSVRPLPLPPEDFAGAVGRFMLESRLDQSSVKLGDTVSWRLTLKGRGNWPMLRGLPSRLLDRDFDLMGTGETAEAAGGSLFEREVSETLLLVPRRAGRFMLGPVEMSVFDPLTAQYVRITAPAMRLDVAAIPGAAAKSPARRDPSSTRELPTPRAGVAPVLTPFSITTSMGLIAGPLLLLLLLWLCLAFAHAQRSDTGRGLRHAHRRLRAALDALDSAQSGPERHRALREWQRQLASRYALGAAPVASDFTHDAVASGLWSEAELALYGREGGIPEDWPVRARAHLQEMPPPPQWQPLAFLGRSHLWPRLAPLLIALIAMPALAGNNSEPYDWHGHYNRALALAKTSSNASIRSEAAVEAAAAWVQAPRVQETRALWAELGSEASLVPSTEGGVPGSSAGDPAGLAWSLSPPEWQRLLALASGLGFAGSALLLLVRFGRVDRHYRKRGGLLLAVSGGIAGLSGGALFVQGPLALPGAILVAQEVSLYALPVEDPSDSGLASVRAGAVGSSDKQFLGWSRVFLADGRSGWVRSNTMIALWQRHQSQQEGSATIVR